MTDCALCSRVLNCYNTNYSTLLGEKYPLYQNVGGFLGTSLCNNCIKIITEVKHLIKEGVPINISHLKEQYSKMIKLEETLENIQTRITKKDDKLSLLQYNLERTEDKVISKDIELTDRCREVEELKSIITNKDNELKETLEDIQTKITKKNNKLSNLQYELERTEDEVISKNREIEELKSIITNKDNEINILKSSNVIYHSNKIELNTVEKSLCQKESLCREESIVKLSPQINPEFIDKYGLEPQIVVDKNNKKYNISISKSQCVFEALCPSGTIFEVTYLYIPGCKIGCCDVMTGHIQNYENYENGCAIIEIIKNGKCILHRYDDKNLRILWIKKNGIRTEVIY